MASDPIRRDEVLRDENASRADSTAPPSGLDSLGRPARAAARDEEEEPRGREWWSLLKALVIGLVAVAVIGWLLSR